MLGSLLTDWTIRAALALFVAYFAGWLAVRSSRWPEIARWIWTAACGLFVAHVACAFHFTHGWSHWAAWEDTARQTKDLMGVEFGQGIYFSYLFLVLWIADVIWMWLAPLQRGTPWTRALVHCFLCFIAFNGAIVFEDGPTRYAGIVACLLLAGLAVRLAYNSWCERETVPTRENVSLTPDS
jgi:hypothetical protein